MTKTFSGSYTVTVTPFTEGGAEIELEFCIGFFLFIVSCVV